MIPVAHRFDKQGMEIFTGRRWRVLPGPFTHEPEIITVSVQEPLHGFFKLGIHGPPDPCFFRFPALSVLCGGRSCRFPAFLFRNRDHESHVLVEFHCCSILSVVIRRRFCFLYSLLFCFPLIKRVGGQDPGGTALAARGLSGLPVRRGLLPSAGIQADDVSAFYQALRFRACVGWTSCSLVTVSR